MGRLVSLLPTIIQFLKIPLPLIQLLSNLISWVVVIRAIVPSSGVYALSKSFHYCFIWVLGGVKLDVVHSIIFTRNAPYFPTIVGLGDRYMDLLRALCMFIEYLT